MLTPAGLGLGMDRGDRFEEILEEAEVPLDGGDVFLFFTDGLSEAMNGRAELFGERRLRDVLEHVIATESDEVELKDRILDRDPRLRGRRRAARRHDDGHPEGGLSRRAVGDGWRSLAWRLALMAQADLVLRGGPRLGGEGPPAAHGARGAGRPRGGGGRRRRRHAWIGARTQVVELAGRLVVPGFNDAHVHFLSGGFGLLSVDLRGARDEADLARLIGGARADAARAGTWILEGQLGPRGLALEGACPRGRHIDAATPDHPVFVQRLDGHMALANSPGPAAGRHHPRDGRSRRAGRSCATPRASRPAS